MPDGAFVVPSPMTASAQCVPIQINGKWSTWVNRGSPVVPAGPDQTSRSPKHFPSLASPWRGTVQDRRVVDRSGLERPDRHPTGCSNYSAIACRSSTPTRHTIPTRPLSRRIAPNAAFRRRMVTSPLSPLRAASSSHQTTRHPKTRAKPRLSTHGKAATSTYRDPALIAPSKPGIRQLASRGRNRRRSRSRRRGGHHRRRCRRRRRLRARREQRQGRYDGNHRRTTHQPATNHCFGHGDHPILLALRSW